MLERAGGDAWRHITCVVMHGDILHMLIVFIKIRFLVWW